MDRRVRIGRRCALGTASAAARRARRGGFGRAARRSDRLGFYAACRAPVCARAHAYRRLVCAPPAPTCPAAKPALAAAASASSTATCSSASSFPPGSRGGSLRLAVACAGPAAASAARPRGPRCAPIRAADASFPPPAAERRTTAATPESASRIAALLRVLTASDAPARAQQVEHRQRQLHARQDRVPLFRHRRQHGGLQQHRQVRAMHRSHVRGRPHPRPAGQPLRRGRCERLPRPRPQVRRGGGDRLLPVQLPGECGVQRHVVLRRRAALRPGLRGASARLRLRALQPHCVVRPCSRLLASQAFDVIADRSKGVVDLLWRQVDCSKRKYSVTSY